MSEQLPNLDATLFDAPLAVSQSGEHPPFSCMATRNSWWIAIRSARKMPSNSLPV